MRKIFVLFVSLVFINVSLAQSSIVISPGASISVDNVNSVSADSRDGTMKSTGTFNSRSIVFDPVATAASNIAQTSFNANWGACAGALGYKIDVSTDVNFGTFVSGYQNKDVGNVTSSNINSGLSYGTTYYYRARAYDIDGITGYSNTIMVVTGPASPVATAGTSINEALFVANWNSVTGAVKYFLDIATDAGFTNKLAGFNDLDVGNVLTYSVSGLSGNTTYYYRIKAVSSSGGLSGYSNAITVLSAPLPPNSIAATPITQTSFAANWNASAGATKYYLDVATANTFSGGTFVTGYQNLDVGNVTSYSVSSGLTAGTTYYYRIRSSNGDGISTNSGTISLITIPPNSSALAATSLSQTNFTANWNASTSATNYYLDVATDNTFTTFVTDWQNKSVGNVTTYLINTNLLPGTTYYYRIRSENSSGISGNSNVITVLTVPPNPVTVAASSITQSSFSANWNASISATKYFLDVATDNGFTSIVTGWNNVDAGTNTSYNVNSNLTSGTTYYYRVRSQNASGTSGNSNITNTILVPANPVAANATNVSQTSFSANWNASTGATKYYLDVATDAGFTSMVTNWNNVDVGNVLTYLVNSNLSIATNYYYRVRAENLNGLSGNSNTITLVTAPIAPVATAGGNSTTSSFTANWNATATATGYLLDVSTDNNFGAGTFVTGFNGRDVGNVLTFSVNVNLNYGTTYFYRVRAYNTGGTGTNSNVITFGTIPLNPISAAATSVGSTSFDANWNNSTGATGYKLDVSTASDFSTFVGAYNNLDVLNVVTYSVTGLNPGTVYYFRVRSYNDYGTSANSGNISVLTAPAAPTVNAATSIAANEFTANWSTSTGANGYYLDVSSQSNFSSFLSGFNSKDVGNSTSYLIPSLSSGTTYYYRVKGYNTGGASSNSVSQSVVTLPSAPSTAAASNITATAFDANWASSTSATGYKLDVSTDPLFGAGNFVSGYQDKDVGNVLTYSVSGLTAGTTYYYRVRGYNGSGTDGSSTIITVVTIPPSPVEQVASSISRNSFSANWSAASGANGYYLDVSTNSGFTAGNFVSGYQNLDVGNILTYTITGLSSSTQYYYRIRAYNSAGTSGNSGTASPVTALGIPKEPASSPASVVTGTSFQANWVSSFTAASYRLDVSPASDFSSFVTGWNDVNVGNVTSYSVNTNVNGGTNYYYRVRAVNAAGTSSNSAVISLVTVPSPPVVQAASVVSNIGFTANWNSSTGAAGYKLDVSPVNTFASFVSGYNDLDVGNTTSHIINGLVGNTTYYYRVRAYNVGGTSLNSGITTQLTDADPVGTVNATAASIITSSGFNANWATYTGATGYKIDVSTASNFSSFIGLYNSFDVGNVLTYAVTGLSGGTTYYYRIKAYDGTGNIGISGNVIVLTMPSAPNANAASSIAELNFTANWTSSTGATGYNLDVATDNSFTNFVSGFNNKFVNSATSYLITGLAGGVTYYYRVTASNGSGTSAASSTITVITLPTEPNVLTASSVQSSSFVANWSSTNGATGYKLDVSTTSNFTSLLASFNNLDVGNVTSKTVDGLNGGTTYYYRLRAYNANGTGNNSLQIEVTTLPPAPTATAATAMSKTDFNANWNSAAGATKYYLDIATTSLFTAGTFVSGVENLDVGNVTSFHITGLSSGISYYYRVRSFNGSGTSDPSSTITALTIPADPLIQSATGIAGNIFTANWSASTGASRYYLDVATDLGFTSMVAGWNNLNVANVTSYDVTGLAANTVYYYRVRAYNASGTSNNSGTTTLITGSAAPVATNASSIQETNFVANWNSIAGADGYRFDISVHSDFSDFVSGFNNKDVGNVTNYIATGLSGGNNYYYRVRAYIGARTSSNSNTITVLTRPPACTATSASLVSSNALTANWNTANGSTKYYLEVSPVSDFSSYVTGFNPKDALTATSYSVTGLNANTTYYYRISCNNASGTGNVSNIITILTAPAAPATIAATSVTNVRFYANWNSSSGATGYYLDVATDAGFVNYVLGYQNIDVGNVTTYQVASLSGSTNYFYRVRAYSSSGSSGNSNTQTPTTLVNPSGVPTSTSATSFAETSFSANWNTVAGATGYRIDVSTNNLFTTYVSGFQDLDIGNVLTTSITGLTGGTTYYYRVRSYNISGTSSNSTTITALTLPVAPTSTAATSLAQTSYTANWNSVSSATKYYLDVSTDAAFGAGTFVTGFNNADVNNVQTYSVTGLTGGTTYYYRVRAYNASGSGNSSSVQTVLTVPSSPVATSATSRTQTGFVANWNASLSATKYYLDVSTDPAFGAGNFVEGFQNKDVANVLSFSLSGLNVNSSYYYRIRALNASGTSGNSVVITAIGIPTATTASLLTLNSFTSNWNIISGATNYKLDVSTDSTFATYLAGWQDVNVAGASTNTKIVNTGLSPNTTYYYRVRSTDGSYTSSNSNRIAVKTSPSAPVASAATTITQSGFIANWAASAGGAAGYKIDVSTDINFSAGTFVQGYENKDVSNVLLDTVNTNILPGTNYYYRVKGYNSGSTGLNSNTITLLTKMQVPNTASATNVTQTSFTANWIASTGATKYFLDVAADNAFTSILPGYNNLDIGNVITYSITGLTTNTRYYYRLRAFNTSETTVSSSGEYVLTTAPPPVANNATLISENGFNANWTPQSGSSSAYSLDVSTAGTFSSFVQGYQALGVTGVTTQTVNVNLKIGIPYFYRVRTYSSFGESGNSNVMCAALQPTNIHFSDQRSTSFIISYKKSLSGGGYLIVRGTGAQPAFVPVNGISYVIGNQGADRIVYVGSDSTTTENNMTAGVSYYYKIYSYHQSGGVTYYVLDSPLTGTNQLLSGSNPTTTLPATVIPTSAIFSDVGVSVSFNSGSAGTTLTASRSSTIPASGIGISGNSVNTLEPLFFTLQSTTANPGVYSIVLDFSSLNYENWDDYKVMKRTDENSQWVDITLPPINAVITNRATDGISGKFTITGLTSFSQFVLGKFVNTSVPQSITMMSPASGVRWMAGSFQQIIWRKTGYFSGVKIEYTKDDGNTWIQINDQILVGLVSFNWTVPTGFNSDRCRIRVSNWNNESISNTTELFTIYDPSVPLQKLGDINNDGLITSYDASLVLQYVVGLLTFNDAEKTAADINSDGIINANDAARILRYVVDGSWTLGKTKAVQGNLQIGNIIMKNDGEIIIPIKSVNASGINSVQFTINLSDLNVKSIGYQNNLGDDWIVLSNRNNSNYVVAMISLNDLSNGLIGNLKLKLSDNKQLPQFTYTVQLNNENVESFILDLQKEIPTEFSLSQNYPNPFNPITTINYQIPVATFVQLKVFDGLGKEITTIVNEVKNIGKYEVIFDGRNFASGVYFYQLKTDNFIKTKKFVLLK